MGFGQTSLSGVRRGFMPPQLKTKTFSRASSVIKASFLGKFQKHKIHRADTLDQSATLSGSNKFDNEWHSHSLKLNLQKKLFFFKQTTFII
jgi:hypothetical protein